MISSHFSSLFDSFPQKFSPPTVFGLHSMFWAPSEPHPIHFRDTPTPMGSYNRPKWYRSLFPQNGPIWCRWGGVRNLQAVRPKFLLCFIMRGTTFCTPNAAEGSRKTPTGDRPARICAARPDGRSWCAPQRLSRKVSSESVKHRHLQKNTF